MRSENARGLHQVDNFPTSGKCAYGNRHAMKIIPLQVMVIIVRIPGGFPRPTGVSGEQANPQGYRGVEGVSVVVF